MIYGIMKNMSFQILCTLTDIHWTVLMQPIPLFPVIAAYCNGLLVRVFDVYCHYLMVSWTCLMVSQISALVWCFALKHRTIGKVTSRRIFSRNVYIIGGIYSVLTPIFTFLTTYETGINRKVQMEYVAEVSPNSLELKNKQVSALPSVLPKLSKSQKLFHL